MCGKAATIFETTRKEMVDFTQQTKTLIQEELEEIVVLEDY